MNPIRATWTQGEIVPAEPVVWPEGTELVVEPASATMGFGLEESRWRDDADALAAWEAWANTIEPRVLTDDERAAWAAYESEQRRFNLEAARRQMAMGEGG
jgi:hypothetical protein